jgi:hypothetical protein
VAPASANQSEIDNFQAGKKKILVFSEAGGTGFRPHQNIAARPPPRLAPSAIRVDERIPRQQAVGGPLYMSTTMSRRGQ